MRKSLFVREFRTAFLWFALQIVLVEQIIAQEQYRTMPCCESVKSLQVRADGKLSRGEVAAAFEISFDYLGGEQQWLSYTILHCNAEWQQDDLSEMDYADGFMPVRIEDVKPSFNTFIPYYHYKITFPNEEVKLTASGNYAVIIHQEDDADEVLAVATFSVSEQLAFVMGESSPNTDIDYKKTHQQLSFEVTWSNSKLPYLDPVNELRIFVRQNGREETRREVKTPSRMEAGCAVYEHNRDLIFDAGNNYRLFEFTDERYASLGVDNVRYHAPYYYVHLIEDKPRSNRNYLYDQDQNGRFLIHSLRVEDEDTEAEYFKACFTLNAEGRGRKDVFLSGDFTYGLLTDEFQMEYDPESDVFRKEILLKQGAYNYLYLVDDKTATIEGDYYETENEYEIYVYYHPNGARYDRLLGIATIK